MSKKKKKLPRWLEADKKIRRTWEINPKTRVKQDERKYKRQRDKKRIEREALENQKNA